jgi:Domain of unknown function (DUF4412)
MPSTSFRPRAITLMARTVSWIAATVVAASPLVARPLAAQSFDGAITMRVSGMGPNGGQAQEIEYLTRGGKVRVNVVSAMGAMSIIGIPAEKKTYLLLDQQSMYMEVNVGEELARAGAGSATMPDVKITRTGKKETIAGYECEHVTVIAPQQTADVCLAKGLGPFVNAMSAMGSMGRGNRSLPAWQRSLEGEGGFPLKVTRQDGVVQLEVTKIEKRVLTDAPFTIPNSYTKMTMPRRP